MRIPSICKPPDLVDSIRSETRRWLALARGFAVALFSYFDRIRGPFVEHGLEEAKFVVAGGKARCVDFGFKTGHSVGCAGSAAECSSSLSGCIQNAQLIGALRAAEGKADFEAQVAEGEDDRVLLAD